MATRAVTEVHGLIVGVDFTVDNDYFFLNPSKDNSDKYCRPSEKWVSKMCYRTCSYEQLMRQQMENKKEVVHRTPAWTPIWLNACCSPVKSEHQDHIVGVDVHWQLD